MALARFCEVQTWEVGLDEVGIGAICGPIISAAVVLPPHLSHPNIKDSKQLSPKKRSEVAKFIQTEALAFAVTMRDNQEVDKLNPIQASIAAMHDCITVIRQKQIRNYPANPPPMFLLIDGKNFIPHPEFAHICIIKGDSNYLSIAAASIIAKVYRDRYMQWKHHQHPDYGWQTNVGYPTAGHLEAIKNHGLTALHRRNIKLKNNPELMRKIYSQN